MEAAAATTKPPQFSEMFQKFATVVKTKTFELFADEEEYEEQTNNNSTDTNIFTLFNSAEEFIPDQKVVVIKPDSCKFPTNTQFPKSLISALFATISSFEASYLQLQTAHVPFNENAIESADKVLVSVLQKLTEMKNLCKDFRRNPTSCSFDTVVGSELEFQVQENQSKLRVLETMVNQMLSYMDSKDDEVLILRKKLEKMQVSNSNLSRKLGVKNDNLKNSMEVLCTVRVFESMLRDSIKSANKFCKLLMELMKRAGWDLEKAANSVYSDVSYVEKGHHKYAFLSYICLGMFKGFDLEDFGLCDEEMLSNGDCSISGENDYLKELLEHVSCNPMEALGKDPSCAFSRFIEKKYEQIIHPTIELSIFRNLDGKEVIVDSWKSLSVFYDLFVRMASSIWLLHKLAYSFNPIVEIFQVERGVDFSMVYMEDVTRICQFPLNKTRPKVGFTVIPGFKIGRTIIQTQVYLTGLKCTE